MTITPVYINAHMTDNSNTAWVCTLRVPSSYCLAVNAHMNDNSNTAWVCTLRVRSSY